jgi:hypothetical protein
LKYNLHFQTLFFLIRDWSVPYEAEYGLHGGQRILDKRLDVTPKQHKELQQLRQHIKSSFANLKCFLMPHPGLDVAISPDFHGQLDSEFLDFGGVKINLLQKSAPISKPSCMLWCHICSIGTI